MNKRRFALAAACVLLPLITLALYAGITRIDPNSQHQVGDRLDDLGDHPPCLPRSARCTQVRTDPIEGARGHA